VNFPEWIIQVHLKLLTIGYYYTFDLCVQCFAQALLSTSFKKKILHVLCFCCTLFYYSCKLRPQLVTLGSLVITKFHKLKVASFTDFSSHLCRPGINFINILREQLMAVTNKLVRFENAARNHSCKEMVQLILQWSQVMSIKCL
jgi:hypothetical protein